MRRIFVAAPVVFLGALALAVAFVVVPLAARELPIVASAADDFVDATGSVAVPVSQFAASAPQRCVSLAPGTQGAFGFILSRVTPGAAFSLVATDANADSQDLDIQFMRTTGGCSPTGNPASDAHLSIYGDESGVVPADARGAVVFLSTGGAATFRYHEYALPTLPLTPLSITNAMHFRVARAEGATSTWFDMYEPHIVVSGTGVIYATGHAPASDTHHSPVFASADDGATWKVLPDPQPLPTATQDVPAVGGRLGVQGDEGGITADSTGRAWLYDPAFVMGASNLFGWCDDGARSCDYKPIAFDLQKHAETTCGGHTGPRALDKPWARYGHGKVLLANAALRVSFVEEYGAASMLGFYDPETGVAEWNTCVGVGSIPGVPALRDSDGMIAVAQVAHDADGAASLVVHHGLSLDTLSTTGPVLPALDGWQPCQLFNGYSTFSAAGTFYTAALTGDGNLAVAASQDFATFAKVAFAPGGTLRYLWIEGSQMGEGALVTWAVAPSCTLYDPMTFYAAHVTLANGALVLTDVSVVVEDVVGPCGHYSGNDLGPDGRAFVIVHASPGGCLGPIPEFAPTFHAPWALFVQDGGPRV